MSGVLPPWSVEEIRKRNVYHVYPCYGRSHEVDGAECWCSPSVEPVIVDDVVVGRVIVHREEN